MDLVFPPGLPTGSGTSKGLTEFRPGGGLLGGHQFAQDNEAAVPLSMRGAAASQAFSEENSGVDIFHTSASSWPYSSLRHNNDYRLLHRPEPPASSSTCLSSIT